MAVKKTRKKPSGNKPKKSVTAPSHDISRHALIHSGEKMDFGSLIKETYSEYKRLFNGLLHVQFFYYFIPIIALTILMLLAASDLMEALQYGNTPDEIFNPGNAAILIAYFAALILISYIWVISVIKHIGFRNKRDYNLRLLISDSKKSIIPYIMLTVVEFAIVIALAVPLVAAVSFLKGPMLFISIIAWFMLFLFIVVSLIFSSNAMLVDGKGVIESLRASFLLVRGRWLKVFGYYLLLAVIMILIYIAVGIPFGIIVYASSKIPLIGTLVSSAVDTVLSIIITPFSMIFTQIFYEKLKSIYG